MPYVWEDSELFLQCGDVSIYHVYKDDRYESGPRTYWYGFTAAAYEDDPEQTFDVRDLDTWSNCAKDTKLSMEARIKKAIRTALAEGSLKVPEDLDAP